MHLSIKTNLICEQHCKLCILQKLGDITIVKLGKIAIVMLYIFTT